MGAAWVREWSLALARPLKHAGVQTAGDDLEENSLFAFLTTHASAVFGLLGILVGSFFSLISGYFLRRQDFAFTLWEKVSERRLKAHEQLLETAITLRTMVALGKTTESGDPLRTPIIMISKQNFDTHFAGFAFGSGVGSTWLTTEAKREANLLQDYMVKLYQALAEVPSERYPNVGLIIRDDLIELSLVLEKKTRAFFEKDLKKASLSPARDWHKYEFSETTERLKKTQLMEHFGSIVDKSHPAFEQAI